MSMSTTNSDQKLTEIGCSGSNNNNFFNNLERREHLFDKVLTPTDATVGIVIPRQHALNYFPPFFVSGQRDRVLSFTDRNGKEWKFSYCYWWTCRMYVLSHGWESFLAEKQLVAGDTVSFHRAYIPDNNRPERLREIMCIDWRRKGEVNLVSNNADDNHQWNLGRSEPLVCNSIPAFAVARVLPSEPSQPSKKKKIRLFGVDIEESFAGATHGDMGVTGCTSQPSTTKRMRLFGVDVVEYSSWSPAVIGDDGQSSRRSPCGEMGASSSSFKPPSDDEDRKRKGKSVQF